MATLIGEVAGAVYYLNFLMHGGFSLSVRISDFQLKGGIMKNVCSIGVSASLGSMLMSVSSVIMNSLMAKYGDMQVAAVGVSMKIVMNYRDDLHGNRSGHSAVAAI